MRDGDCSHPPPPPLLNSEYKCPHLLYRYDSFVPSVTDDYLVQANTVQRARCVTVRPVFGPLLVDGPALVRGWVGVPCLLGGYPLCVVSVLVHRLRRCPGTAMTLGRSWCLLGFPILCNNVTFGCLVQHRPICFFTTYILE